MAGPREYNCLWCRVSTTIGPEAQTCPACGAGVDVRLMTDEAGWYGLPPIRGMARLQFGASHCQIEGTYVPVADFNLAVADHLYFNHHVLLWKEPRTLTPRLPLKGWWRRLLAGLPLVMLQAKGPGRIAFSKDAPGELIAGRRPHDGFSGFNVSPAAASRERCPSCRTIVCLMREFKLLGSVIRILVRYRTRLQDFF